MDHLIPGLLSNLMDPAYDTMAGRRIVEMKNKALAEAAKPVVDFFFEMAAEFVEDEGIEKFQCVVCAEPNPTGGDLYEKVCQLEDLGPEWCANVLGLKIKRKNVDEVYIMFAKKNVEKPAYIGPLAKTLSGDD